MAKNILFALNAETLFSPTDENGHELEGERIRIALSAVVTKEEYIWLLKKTNHGLITATFSQRAGRPKKEDKPDHPDVIRVEDYEDGNEPDTGI